MAPQAQHLHLQVHRNKGEEEETELCFHKTVNLVLGHTPPPNKSLYSHFLLPVPIRSQNFQCNIFSRWLSDRPGIISVSSFMPDYTAPVTSRLS